ncbi:hypothetical protein VDG1235_1439 [Verrucomicrobiia bacterium DG1235]|nr:hypothetical protein VDG1235_1439 [Verrucomicrobiae bacterium DG1235]
MRTRFEGNISAQIGDWPKGKTTEEVCVCSDSKPDFLDAFCGVVESSFGETALYLRDPRGRGRESKYLSLSFSDLMQEIEAWGHRFRMSGIGVNDRVLLWLPRGLAMVAASYALMKIGAEVAVLEESKTYAVGVSSFEPNYAVASNAVSSRLKKLHGSGCEVLELKSPLLRLAVEVKLIQPLKPSLGRMRSGVTFFRGDAEGVRFGPDDFSALLDACRSGLRIEPSRVDFNGDALMTLIYPALGVSSVVLETGFGAVLSKRI